MDIISQRNHYKKAFDELTQQLASKVSESVESQTSVINLNIEDLKSTYETKINKLQNELEKVISERKFLKSSYRHSQEELDKAFRLVESHRLEKDKIIAEKENLLRQITILESVKQFIEQSFEQSQEELGKSKSKIERLKEDFEAVSLEKSSLQSALVQNQSQIAKLNTEFEQLAGDYKSKEFEKQSLDASYSRTQIEVEQLKSKISQAEKKSKAFESEGCILQKNLNSLSLQLIDSVRDANDLRSLNQKLLSDYNTLVDKLFQQNGKVAQIVNEQNLATTLKDVNQLLDEARSNEITLSNNLKDRNATITDLSEKLRKESQEKLEIEKNYQKTINDLSLHHTHALEVYRQHC
jgi:chromosome segregation ATPase